jgi:hypothetical protein
VVNTIECLGQITKDTPYLMSLIQLSEYIIGEGKICIFDAYAFPKTKLFGSQNVV